MLECGGKAVPMNSLFSFLLCSLFTLVICPRTSSMPTSDEETLKNLEMEAAKHSGFSDADVAFQKSILGPRVISIDPLGHVYDQSPADYEKMIVGIRTANPDAKASTDIHDVKVDRKSTRLNSSHTVISYAVFCLKKKKNNKEKRKR